MKKNDFRPSPSETILLGFLLLAALEGLTGVYALLRIPTDPKNLFFLGYSAVRLAVLGGMITAASLLLGVFIRLIFDPGLLTDIEGKSTRLLRDARIVLPLIGGFSVLLVTAGVFLGTTYLDPDPVLGPRLIRLAPLTSWVFLFSIQSILYLGFKKTQPWTRERVLPLLLEILIFLLAAVSIFSPRISDLDRFATVDEEKWAVRSANFYVGLRNLDFGRTNQVGHPGVLPMWAGALGVFSQFPELHTYAPEIMEANDYIQLLNKHGFHLLTMLVAGRRMMVAGQTLVLLTVYLYLRKILGPFQALAGILFLAFDPFHLGHSRLLHLDGMLSSLMLIALLAFFTYQEYGNRLDLFVSGFAMGFAWLTKSTGLFLIPGLLFIWLLKAQENDGIPGFPRIKPTWRTLIPLISPLILGGAVFTLFWPAMWTAPIDTFSEMINKAVNYAAVGHDNPVFFNGQIYPDGNIGFFSTFYPVSYFWRATPIALIGLLAAGVGLIRRYKPFEEPHIYRLGLGILLFGLSFLVLINLGEKKFDRYLLPIYLPFDLLGFLGLLSVSSARLWPWNKPRNQPSLSKIINSRTLVAGLLLLISAAQGFLALSNSPYYLTYYNPLLGGIETATGTMMIGWGEGLDEAARYLNGVQEETPLVVVSWYNSVFNLFFDGNAKEIKGVLTDKDEELRELLAADYAVIYIHEWQRNIPEPLLDVLRPYPPEVVIQINGIEYVMVYDLNEIR